MSRKVVRRRTERDGRPVGLVDLDVVAFQVCSDCTVEERVGDDEYAWTLDMKLARANMATRLGNLKREAGCGRLVLCVGSRQNWRKRLEPSYKANRIGRKKPLGYWALIEHLRKEHDVREHDWLEADDVIGLLHTGPEFKAFGVETIVISNDKDFLQLPGKLYDFHDPSPRVREISRDEADLNHLVRALAGDTSDGYKGARGVGEKGAMDAFARKNPHESIEDVALRTFLEAGHDKAYAELQCQLARVLRHGEYDPETGELKLWRFPSPRKPARAVVKRAAGAPARRGAGGGVVRGRGGARGVGRRPG